MGTAMLRFYIMFLISFLTTLTIGFLILVIVA